MFVRLSVAAVAAASISTAAVARDYVSMTGSSTVFPFATIVAEAFGQNPNFNTPVVESTGSSAGKRGACNGIGTEFVDIGNASSRMKAKDLASCVANGIEVTEVKVGYDGIVLANSIDGPTLEVTKGQLWQALAAKIPAGNAKWIDNPYQTWSDIDASLPNVAIRVYGPPSTSGTRASWEEMVNEKGCTKVEGVSEALAFFNYDEEFCMPLRTDGAFIEAGEQDNLIVQKLQEEPESYGIFGFSFLNQNADALQGAIVDGVEPDMDTIAAGEYPVARALYFYIKKPHVGVVPGVQEYAREWTKHWAPGGVLEEAGMVPMPAEERAEYAAVIENLPTATEETLKN